MRLFFVLTEDLLASVCFMFDGRMVLDIKG